MSNILTCVYCGHAYPEGTPPHGAKILTDHIKVCEKHPMRALERENAIMREALSEIHTTAHCISKAGPLHTPTLQDAWGKFDRLGVMATNALWQARHNEIVEAQKHVHETPLQLD